MPTSGLPSVRQVRQREPLAPLSFNLVGGLLATALAAAAYLLALVTTAVPASPFSSVLFAWAPAGALIACPILAARARRDGDQMLGWFAAGLGVAVLAMVLQVISFPAVATDGGPLHTSAQASASLYLLFHVVLYLAALAGAGGAAPRLRGPATVLGLLLTVAVATDLVPLPLLLTGSDQRYTSLLLGLEAATAALGALALVVWTWRAGRPALQLRAWVGLALALSVYDVTLNALAGERFDPVWWASLSLRLATFALLAGGCVWTVVRELGRVERYSEVELALRDREIRGSVAVTDLLLANAQRLGESRTPHDVADAIRTTAQALNGVRRASVVGLDGAHLVDLDAPAPVGSPVQQEDGDGPAEHDLAHQLVARAGTPVFLDDPSAVAGALPGVLGTGGADVVQALAAVPIEASGRLIGSLVVESGAPRVWSPGDRELLSGVADQAGPALDRAVLAERDRRAAETLQRSLLPKKPSSLAGIDCAVRYRAATSGTMVGGDWVDCWQLGDGRVALLVGDVVGKGLVAAATMGRLRAAIRALAQVDPTPSVVLRRLDEMESEDGSELVATVLYLVVDGTTGRADIGRAGHLPLLVGSPIGGHRFVTDGGSPPIGVGGTIRPDVSLELEDGAVLVLFTDGLIERRTEAIGDGLALLGARLETVAGGSADDVADAVMRLVPTHGAADDIAVLVARVGTHQPGLSR